MRLRRLISLFRSDLPLRRPAAALKPANGNLLCTIQLTPFLRSFSFSSQDIDGLVKRQKSDLYTRVFSCRLGLDPGVFCWVSFLYPTYDSLLTAVDPTPGPKPNKHT